jgi:hypothetical protein
MMESIAVTTFSVNKFWTDSSQIITTHKAIKDSE